MIVRTVSSICSGSVLIKSGTFLCKEKPWMSDFMKIFWSLQDLLQWNKGQTDRHGQVLLWIYDNLHCKRREGKVNWTSWHNGIWGSGGTALRSLHPGTIRSAYPPYRFVLWRKAPRSNSTGDWVGPRSCLKAFWRQKFLAHVRNRATTPRTSNHTFITCQNSQILGVWVM